MMNCKDLLRTINLSISEMYPSVLLTDSRNIKSIEGKMRILAINMIMDGEY